MRSALYVPGDSPAKLAKALGSGADALIVDLEDAVPLSGKAAARGEVAAWLDSLGDGDRPELWVRINPGEAGHEDVRAVSRPVLAGFCVAKAESVAGLAGLLPLLDGHHRLVPLLESAAAVLAAAELARAPRVVRLQLGEADLGADLGVRPGPEGLELLLARSMVVLASAAAGIAPAMAPVSTEFRDLDAFRASTERLRALGFAGRACIHPHQIPVVHDVFTPSADEIKAAEDVVGRYTAALAAGSAVCVDAHGRLVDEAVVRSARRVLSLPR
ncbi:HpcH/HpaI aldolase/citrate lyase family protein [Actinocorallia longicatena]|uniref:CoA ester lyase n=1 Tax=Actinocorallia longicatena TaxID=111803 RepID=A0ABP6Q723_9ACTN